LALCAVRLGRSGDARVYSKAALKEFGTEMDDDDAAYAWSRLSSVQVMLGDTDAAAAMACKASDAMVQLRATRDSLKSRLDVCFATARSRQLQK
jgi:hypothetical protein